jgi:hypothetical protein
MAAHAIDGPKVSNSLHEAFSHLLTAPWQPDPPRGPSGADATAHNEAARLRFNEDLEGLGGLGEGWEESGERSFREEAGAHNFASICSACRPCEHDRSYPPISQMKFSDVFFRQTTSVRTVGLEADRRREDGVGHRPGALLAAHPPHPVPAGKA